MIHELHAIVAPGTVMVRVEDTSCSPPVTPCPVYVQAQGPLDATLVANTMVFSVVQYDGSYYLIQNIHVLDIQRVLAERLDRCEGYDND
jgi:hypothetical protein